MRSKIRLALATTVVGALTVAAAAPVGAGEEPAGLGLALDETQTQPGAVVLGQVDADDVAEHCITTVEGIQDEIGRWLNEVLGDTQGELFQTFFPDADFIDLENLRNFDQAAYAVATLLAFGVLVDLQGAAGAFLDRTFAFTFADIATQQPVGEISSFDPDTGDGSVTVPDVEPGLRAVAAACATPSFDVPTLISAVEAGGDYLEGLGIPLEEMPLQLNLADLEPVVRFLEEHGPAIIQPMMTPRALGTVLFCILDPQGDCPAAEEPAPPPGEPATLPGDESGPAQPVTAAPSFTG